MKVKQYNGGRWYALQSDGKRLYLCRNRPRAGVSSYSLAVILAKKLS